MVRVTVSYVDYYEKTGLFSFMIADTYGETPYTELLAYVQDLLDASQCAVEKIQVAHDISIASLTSNVAVDTGSFDRMDDQAILTARAADGTDIKISIPAPVDAVFEAAGSHALQDADMDGVPVAALVLTGETTPLLVTKSDAVVSCPSSDSRQVAVVKSEASSERSTS